MAQYINLSEAKFGSPAPAPTNNRSSGVQENAWKDVDPNLKALIESGFLSPPPVFSPYEQAVSGYQAFQDQINPTYQSLFQTMQPGGGLFNAQLQSFRNMQPFTAEQTMQPLLGLGTRTNFTGLEPFLRGYGAMDARLPGFNPASLSVGNIATAVQENLTRTAQNFEAQRLQNQGAAYSSALSGLRKQQLAELPDWQSKGIGILEDIADRRGTLTGIMGERELNTAIGRLGIRSGTAPAASVATELSQNREDRERRSALDLLSATQDILSSLPNIASLTLGRQVGVNAAQAGASQYLPNVLDTATGLAQTTTSAGASAYGSMLNRQSNLDSSALNLLDMSYSPRLASYLGQEPTGGGLLEGLGGILSGSLLGGFGGAAGKLGAAALFGNGGSSQKTYDPYSYIT